MRNFGLGLDLPNGEDVLPAQSRALARRVLDRVQNLPGVIHAGMTEFIALTGVGGSTHVLAEGAPDPGRGKYPEIHRNSSTPGFFAAMGIPLLKGRLVSERDGVLPMIPLSGLVDWYKSNPGLPVVVNQTAARRFWPNQDPIGRRLRWAPEVGGPWLTVVGVVGDVKNKSLAAPAQPAMYFSLSCTRGVTRWCSAQKETRPASSRLFAAHCTESIRTSSSPKSARCARSYRARSKGRA